MRWGVRKSRTPVRTSADYKKTAPLRNRKPSELSNKQLQQVNARINMEQQYNRHHFKPSTLARGQALAAGIISLSATIGGLYKISQTPHGKMMINAGEQFLKKIPKKAAKAAVSGQLRLPL